MAVRNEIPFAKYPINVVDDSGTVDPDYVITNNGETVSWTAGDTECWITFGSSQKAPLRNFPPVLHLGPNETQAFTVQGNAKKSYKYTVIGTGGMNDPTIIVDN
jgi:hypothetical protein